MEILYRIRWLFLLLATQLVSAVFTLIKEPSPYTYPDDDPNTHPRFPLTNVEVTDNTYWYFIFTKCVPIMLAWYILGNAKYFRIALKVFLWIQVIDWIDYVLAYGQIWFYIGTMPISWNILKVAFFSLAIVNEVLLEVEKSRSLE